MDKLSAISQLRDLLRQMERDLGIECLSRKEKDVLLAVRSLTSHVGDVVGSDKIKQHECIENTPHATFHRAIRKLGSTPINYLSNT
jgi:hypothetical protein